MTNLNLQQDSNVEIVSATILKKIYDLATSNEIQSCNLEGNLQTQYCWDIVYDYLTGNISEGVKRFPNLTINVTNDKYIYFADSAVQNVLLNSQVSGVNQIPSLSSDGIGVTYKEAQSYGWFGDKIVASQIYRHLKFNSTNIRTFDELNLFGPISICSSVFENCKQLESINLSTVNYIGSRCFSNCTNLRIKLNIPNLTATQGGVFFNSGITEVENLGTITSIYDGAGQGYFANCPNLTKVVLPETCTTIGANTFANCPNLTDVHPISQLTNLGGQSFSTRSTFGILHFSNVTAGGSIFSALGTITTTVRQVYLPKLLGGSSGYSQPGNAYYHAGLFDNLTTDLLYLRDLNYFSGCAFVFSNINSLVIDNVTPPTLHNYNGKTDEEFSEYLDEHPNYLGSKSDLFYKANITNIYVPDSAVNTYKTTAVWSDKADIIKPISELTKVATEEDLQEGQIALIEAYMDTASNS